MDNALTVPDPHVRWRSLWVLGRYDDPSPATARLRAALDSREEDVRWNAAVALSVTASAPGRRPRAAADDAASGLAALLLGEAMKDQQFQWCVNRTVTAGLQGQIKDLLLEVPLRARFEDQDKVLDRSADRHLVRNDDDTWHRLVFPEALVREIGNCPGVVGEENAMLSGRPRQDVRILRPDEA